jgi:hypothetical protein
MSKKKWKQLEKKRKQEEEKRNKTLFVVFWGFFITMFVLIFPLSPIKFALEWMFWDGVTKWIILSIACITGFTGTMWFAWVTFSSTFLGYDWD